LLILSVAYVGKLGFSVELAVVGLPFARLDDGGFVGVVVGVRVGVVVGVRVAVVVGDCVGVVVGVRVAVVVGDCVGEDTVGDELVGVEVDVIARVVEASWVKGVDVRVSVGEVVEEVEGLFVEVLVEMGNAEVKRGVEVTFGKTVLFPYT